jgi:Coenzyme PQQ synthesis protein D (PqqD)
MNDVCFRVNAPQVIHESIEGEVIIINLETGNYYSVKGSGAHVWDVIQAAPAVSTSTVVDAVAPAYDSPREELAPAIDGFVGQLLEEGLLAETAGSAVAPPTVATGAGDGDGRVFEAPRLEKYTDMQDLVLLDPVHEVDEQGWPQQRPEAGANAA